MDIDPVLRTRTFSLKQKMILSINRTDYSYYNL